ncbi:MAG: hypothetical protein H7210_07425 [Pyrinomonadaceae bacterium]|nr:hypothetical protein [Phycisphaerales bacterium]
MKNRMNARLGALGVVAAVLTAAVVVPLVAQPEFPTAPVPGKSGKNTELLVPPGVYSAFVFSSEASSFKVAFRTTSGVMTIIVPANDTVVIPMPGNFTLGQQGAIMFISAGGSLFASGITPSGPVTFEHVKK